MLSEEVLKNAASDMLDYQGCGMSVTEMSHRSKQYEAIHFETIALFRELMNIGDSYHVLLLQGGASMQFEAVPLNLLVKGKADYIVTGNFASKAFEEAKKYGDIACAASSKDKNFSYIPDVDKVTFRDGIDYAHITLNNTIYGTHYTKLPKVKNLVTDASSNILGEVIDVNKFDLIYAGAQKNIGPAGLTVVIVKKDIINNPMKICPTMLKYTTQAENDSLYNTPPCTAIYFAMLSLRELKRFGGVSAMQKQNVHKAKMLYDFIDNSKLFKNSVAKNDRSIMNVPFVTSSEELDAKFIKEAAANGLTTLKGHKSVGGMRASIYNAMPVEGVEKLVSFMKEFESKNK